MDMAVIGIKYLKKHGKLDNLEVSEENNACSIYIDVHYTHDKTGKPCDEKETWLLMFKNETHNHPTEIEPFGGAATCLGNLYRWSNPRPAFRPFMGLSVNARNWSR